MSGDKLVKHFLLKIDISDEHKKDFRYFFRALGLVENDSINIALLVPSCIQIVK
jgi:hypothetical protein